MPPSVKWWPRLRNLAMLSICWSRSSLWKRLQDPSASWRAVCDTMARLPAVLSTVWSILRSLVSPRRRWSVLVQHLCISVFPFHFCIIFQFLGVAQECANLLKHESTPADVRALAGSVITLLTDMPVASTVDDNATGSYAHVNIVLPSPGRLYHADAALAKMQAGARAEDVSFLEKDIVLTSGMHS